MDVTTLAPPQGGPASTQEIEVYDEQGHAITVRVEISEARPVYVTIATAMILTGLSRDTIWQMRKNDRLPSITRGRTVLIPLAALNKLTTSADFAKIRAWSQQRVGWNTRRPR